MTTKGTLLQERLYTVTILSCSPLTFKDYEMPRVNINQSNFSQVF